MGKRDLRTVIAPSGYARSSDFRISSVIKGLIGRSHDVFWRKRGMTSLKYLSIQSSLRGDNRGQAIFELGKNKLIRSPLEFFALQKIGVTILKIGRFLDIFWRKRGRTKSIMSYSCLTRVSSIIKWILGTSPRMIIGLIFLTSTNMTGTAKAECVPQPNCASIGYTETSCETQSVKCPFDATKLYCLPCDSKYQYSCSGVGESGSGNGCKGKYESCGCANNYVSFCDVIFCS